MNTSESLISILEQLSSTTKINEKLSILKQHESNKMWKMYCSYVTDPFLIFGIKKFDVNAVEFSGTGSDFSFMFSILDKLVAREITGNNARDILTEYCKFADSNIRRLLNLALLKDLKCGISRTLLARVWPEFDTEVKLCKARPYSDKNIKNIIFPAISDEKEDGARCKIFVTFHKNNEPTDYNVVSGNNIVIKQFPIDMINEIDDINKSSNINESYIVDGEILARENDGTLCDRKKSNGIVNKLLKGTASQEEIDMICFVVWDYILLKEYNGEVPATIKYIDRRKSLNKFIEDSYSGRFIKIRSKIVNNISEAIEHFRECFERGKEGTILKNKNFVWEGKRSKHCVKFKLEIDVTLRINDMKIGEADTKFENTMGALICSTDCGKLVVNVGTGFKDDERDYFWKNKEKFIGKYIDVRSNGIISNKNDSERFSLFLPRFVKERLEKTHSDSIEYINEQSSSNVLGVSC